MIRTFVIAIFVICNLACSVREDQSLQTADTTAIVAEIDAIISELAEAIIQGNAVDVYDRHLAPNYVFVSAAGRVSTRQQMLSELRSGSVEFEEFRFTNDVVQVHGNVVVAMGLGSGRGVNPGGEQFQGQHRYIAVFVRMDGRWLLSAWQTTSIAES